MIGAVADIAVFVLCYVLGKCFVRVDPVLWLVLSVNLVLTGLFADQMHMVAAADLGSAAVLMFRDRRSLAVASLFVAMPMIYYTGTILGATRFAIYANVALLAYIQWAIAGHVDKLPHLVARYSARRLGNHRRSGSVTASERLP